MQKIRRGRGFAGVLRYLLDHDKPEVIGGTVTSGSAEQMTHEFVAISGLRKDIAKPVWHNSLRLPVGEQLNDEKWLEIAGDYVERIGIGDGQWIAIKHALADGEHIHIVANRVRPDLTVYLGKNENLKSTRIIADLEKKHGLQITKKADLDVDNKVSIPLRSGLKKNETERALRTGEAPVRLVLQATLDEAIKGRPTFRDFAESLRVAGVTIHPSRTSAGQVRGIAFKLDGVSFAGSKLGKKYKWSELQRRIEYDAKRDNRLMEWLVNEKSRAGEEPSTRSEPEPKRQSQDRERDGAVPRQNVGTSRKVNTATWRRGREVIARDKAISNVGYRSDAGTNHATRRSNSPDHFLKGDDMSETDFQKRKKQLKPWEIMITGTPRDVPEDEKKRFQTTLEKHFEQRDSGWYSKKTGLLAFTEQTDKIIGGPALMNSDGTYNVQAMKAMKQAAKMKFGDVFESTGPKNFRRESWLASALIGCKNTGWEPQSADFDSLVDAIAEHEQRFGRKPKLHADIQKMLNEHQSHLDHLREHIKPAFGGKSPAERASKDRQREQAASEAEGAPSISNQLSRWRELQEHDEEKNLQQDTHGPRAPRPWEI